MKKNHSRKIPWVGTSWKMNKTRAEARAFAESVRGSRVCSFSNIQPFIIPPFPYIADVAHILAGTSVKIGGQNMHWCDQGAWTGEISATMLKDCGATLVEIGHSERRTHFNETNETVALKTKAALENELVALVCIGDTLAEYEQGETEQALEQQVRALFKYVSAKTIGKVVIAYEPVWSIGESGTAATPEFANEQHLRIANLALEITGASVPILYGGSVTKNNCVNLIMQPHIDGLFIGRAAWNATDYIDILNLVLQSAGDKE